MKDNGEEWLRAQRVKAEKGKREGKDGKRKEKRKWKGERKGGRGSVVGDTIEIIREWEDSIIKEANGREGKKREKKGKLKENS